MIDQLIAKHGELPALPAEKRLLFFTVALAKRQNRLLTENLQGVRAAFREVKQAHPFTMEAVVILPDHLHCIWALPEGDDNFSTRWRQIKEPFSRQLHSGHQLALEPGRRLPDTGTSKQSTWGMLINDPTPGQPAASPLPGADC
jgi:putative transposase